MSASFGYQLTYSCNKAVRGGKLMPPQMKKVRNGIVD
jgi:hypothetical protein